MGLLDWVSSLFGAGKNRWKDLVYAEIISRADLKSNFPKSFQEIHKLCEASYNDGLTKSATGKLPRMRENSKTVDQVGEIQQLLKKKEKIDSAKAKYSELFYRVGQLVGALEYTLANSDQTEAELKTWMAMFQGLGVWDVIERKYRSTFREITEVPLERETRKRKVA